MNDAPSPSLYRRLPFFYGWINVAVAVVASASTLPGRTWGLGLITTQLLDELTLDQAVYANYNFWATIIGSAFLLPVGWLIDRFGTRVVLTGVLAALAATVLPMSNAQTGGELFLWMTLSRGFGQGMLSVVAIALVGKWFVRRVSFAMMLYTVFMILAFSAAEQMIGWAVSHHGWRQAWREVGYALLFVVMPFGLLLARRTPESCGLEVDGGRGPVEEVAETEPSFTLGQVLTTPIFWVFAFCGSVNSLTQAGIGLFGGSLFKSLGFNYDLFVTVMVIATFAALPGNVLTGLLGADPRGTKRLLAAGMGVLAVSLAWLALPQLVGSLWGLYAWGAVWGLACGIVSVAFFSIWGRIFGREHLGKIQGALMIIHVLSSASGPVVMTACLKRTGSYAVFFAAFAALAAVGALAAATVPIPKRDPVVESTREAELALARG